MSLSKTFSSANYVGKDGRTLTLVLSDTLYDDSAVTNKSRVKWSLSTSGGWEYANYYDTYCYIAINGQQVYFSNGTLNAGGYNGWITSNTGTPEGIWYDKNGVEYTCAKRGFNTSGEFDIIHDSNGTKSITVTFLVGIYYYVVVDCGGSFTLNTIDRSGPSIYQNNITNRTYNSCRISAYSTSICNNWKYRKRKLNHNWGSWINLSGYGLNNYATVSGLSPNTTYEFQFQASKTTNGVSATSNIKSIKTLGASTLKTVTKEIVVNSNDVI